MPRAPKSGIKGLHRGPDGRYKIDLRYTDRNGVEQRHLERFPLGTPTGAARLRAQQVLAASIAGTLEPRGKVQPTRFEAAFTEYVKLSNASNPKQKERHGKELLASFGDVALSEISEIAIERFKRTRADADKAPSTINRELQTLKHFFTCAIEWGWTESRPRVRLLKEPPGRVRWLSEAEREKLNGELPPRFRRVVLAAALSGQRLSNVIGLTRDRVDLNNRTLSIPKTKSGKRHDVPISDALAVVIQEAIADGDAMVSEGRIKEPPSHVFLSRLGAPYTSSGVSGLFRKCAKRAGVKNFRFHDLRHDFATQVRRAGHGLDVVQALLGHSTPAMTQRYAHIGRAELDAAVRAVNVATTMPPAAKKRSRKQPKKAAAS